MSSYFHALNQHHNYIYYFVHILHENYNTILIFSGLTGGSTSGKSSIARYLEDLGAGIIDCDKLGHKAYEPGTECYSKILEAFGQDLKTENGKIDRKKLGPKVFSSPEALHQLESIVWPEILKMAKDSTQILFEQGKKVIVWDAAVLLQVKFMKFI